jgi:hypothetical protein
MAARRTGVAGRWWFAGFGALCLLVAVAGFAPQSLEMIRRGADIPVELHVHGVLMTLFLLAFVAQAVLAGSGSVALHRRLGTYAALLFAVAWVSMLVVLDSAMRRESPFEFPFLPKVLTLGMVQSLVLPALFAAAIGMRNRPDWHRRLMAFVPLIAIQGGLDRMAWLPTLPLPSFWGNGARLYLLALPLVAFDLATLRRLHPANLAGLGVLTLYNAVLAVLWASERYDFAFRAVWLRFYGT